MFEALSDLLNSEKFHSINFCMMSKYVDCNLMDKAKPSLGVSVENLVKGIKKLNFVGLLDLSISLLIKGHNMIFEISELITTLSIEKRVKTLNLGTNIFTYRVE